MKEPAPRPGDDESLPADAVRDPVGSVATDKAVHGRQTNPPVSSTQLFQGRQVVEISHKGTVYRLQMTRLGKLILTK